MQMKPESITVENIAAGFETVLKAA